MRICGIRSPLRGPNWPALTTIGRSAPNTVLESRFGYQRFSQRIGINNNIDPNALGLNTGPLGAGPQDKENFEVPTLYGYSFGNTTYGFVGGVQGYPIVTRPDASYDWQEHFTKIKGNHTIKIGGQYQDAYTKSRRDRAHSALYFYYLGNYLDYSGAPNVSANMVGESGARSRVERTAARSWRAGLGVPSGLPTGTFSRSPSGFTFKTAGRSGRTLPWKRACVGTSREHWERETIWAQISFRIVQRPMRTDLSASRSSHSTTLIRTISAPE